MDSPCCDWVCHYPVNQPLKQVDLQSGYRPRYMGSPGNSENLLFYLTFSGGGTRAAALSYGVLEELRKTEVVIDGKKRRLLDEVDGISGVSGGSFTAGYYGLFGDRIFEDFESKFLKKKYPGSTSPRGIKSSQLAETLCRYFWSQRSCR